MDWTQLKQTLRPLIGALKDLATTNELPSLCARLGLPPPSPDARVKREMLLGAFDAVLDEQLPEVARRFLREARPSAAVRNQIEDLLDEKEAAPQVLLRYRREVAKELERIELFLDPGAFLNLLASLWVLEPDDPFFETSRSLRAQIDRHVIRNPGDWEPDVLFKELGAYECTDRRFARFLEGLASASVRPQEESQRHFVEIVNEPLRRSGAALRETGTEGGYPVFRLVALSSAPSGRPKNIIFASPRKPDIRFRDAMDNNIEVLNELDVLVYDRSIGPEGLRWSDLQAWWQERGGVATAEEAKRTLYERLRDSLPETSPPQRHFFRAFFEVFKPEVARLPALLPEVWLHWDPKTARERGTAALARFRMDFLLLLPNGVRVVIEVDGKHHYSDDEGRGSPKRYAELVAADRDLRLSGYEVHRFGTLELDSADKARDLVREFFHSLFTLHGVTGSRP